jgi:heme iron utilization protein
MNPVHTENMAKNARLFLRKNRNGILSTISVTVDQYPFGSVCPYMVDNEGRPIVLMSDIAQHTKNILVNMKVCLTVMDETKKHRLDGGRVSYVGKIGRVGPKRLLKLQERFLRIFPEAQSYFEAHDFHYYQIEPQRLRYIEGFAKIYWVEKQDVLLEDSTLIEDEAVIINHMNNAHKTSLINYCKHFYGLIRQEPHLIAVDPEGFTVRTENEDLYFPYEKECYSSEDVRAEMVRMAKDAKGVLA